LGLRFRIQNNEFVVFGDDFDEVLTVLAEWIAFEGAAPVAPVVNTSDALDAARAAATAATNFDELCTAIDCCNHPLKSFAKTIPPHFASCAVTIITDSPSGDDEASNKILSGASGDLLDKMLSAVGLSRESVAIVPLVFWRPAGGRTPSREELDLARPFVSRAIELVQPRIALTLGSLAATEFADAKLPAQHGEVFPGAGFSIIPIFHPNYLLLKPDAKKPVWDALQKMQNLLQSAEK
jgi:DNA polymerase